jgi:hypothetical protein
MVPVLDAGLMARKNKIWKVTRQTKSNEDFRYYSRF